MSEPTFQAPGESGDDEPEELEIEIDDRLDVLHDEAPNATDVERSVCPYCDKSWTDRSRKAHLTMHLKFAHKEEQQGHSHDPDKPQRQKPGPKPKTDSAPRGAGSRALREVHDNVEFFYNMAGSILSMKDEVCGGTLQQMAPSAAKAWVELAKTNTVARKFWSGGAAATGWLQLAMAHMPLVMAVNTHHLTPRLQARQAEYEAAMMGGDGESIEDLAGQPVVYTTEPVAATVEGAFIPEGAGEGYTTSDLGYDVGENGFTASAFQ